jgi:hypothetical protein
MATRRVSLDHSSSTASSSSRPPSRRERSLSRTPPPDRTPPVRRVSKRHRRGSFDSVDSSLSSHTAGDDSSLRLPTPTPAPTRPLTKPRENVEYCIEFGLPSKLCCSGCNIFAQSRDPPLNLDSVEAENVMAINIALSTRHKLKG